MDTILFWIAVTLFAVVSLFGTACAVFAMRAVWKEKAWGFVCAIMAIYSFAMTGIIASLAGMFDAKF